MEPLHPDARLMLKQAHPGLTDDDIDRHEELLEQRMLYDPVKEAERIAEIDRRRMELIHRTMPRYAEVMRAFSSRNAANTRRSGPQFTVEPHLPKR